MDDDRFEIHVTVHWPNDETMRIFTLSGHGQVEYRRMLKQLEVFASNRPAPSQDDAAFDEWKMHVDNVKVLLGLGRP